MIEALIHRLGNFLTLSDEDKQQLNDAIVRVDEIDENQEILSEDEKPEHIHLIIEGWACRYKYLEQGQRIILGYLIPGDLCDVHIALLDHMDHSIGTLTPAKVALIPRETVNRIFEENATLARAFFWTALIEESTLREWFVNNSGRSTEKRLAHLFCEMQVRYRAAGLAQDNHSDFPLTQEELADAMGVTVVHTNRVLQRLRKEGMITLAGKRLTINDWERLRAFAEFSPNYLHLSEDILK